MSLQRSSAALGALCVLLGFAGVGARRAAKTAGPRHDLLFLDADHQSKPDVVTAAPPIDYNPETKIVWVDKSSLPLSAEALVALTWITMVSCLPLMAFQTHFVHITKTQLAVVIVMWISLAVGIFLFTQVILFQSSHFESIRSLTLVECVYFMCQVVTTVGYGDITPAKPRGQVFVGLYVIFCILVIANVISEDFQVFSNISEKVFRTLVFRADKNSTPEKEPSAASQWIENGPPQLPWRSFWRSFVVYLLFCLAGVLFYVFYPGEGKSCLQGVYMSVITLSTVGFGAVTPVTEGGKVFAAFWMLFGSYALVGLIGNFTSLMAAVKAREQYDPSEAENYDKKMVGTLPESLGKTDFLKFGLLHAKLSTEGDLKRLEQAFNCLKPAADGTISKDALHKLFTPQYH